MKHIFDSATDEAREDGTITPELKVKVLKLEQLKKASST
jgi:hypothetical protein